MGRKFDKLLYGYKKPNQGNDGFNENSTNKNKSDFHLKDLQESFDLITKKFGDNKYLKK